MKINYERIKYSPFGKEILEGFRIILIPVLIVIPLVFFISLVCFSVSWILGLITIPFVIGLPILNFSPLKETLLKALLLSLMTEEEHETLIAEYKKHKDENNIIRGQLTSYGILLSDGILPWKAIDKITFSPGEYKLVKTRQGPERRYYSPKITVSAVIENRRITLSQGLQYESHDLKDEIESFIESIPKYTEHKFEINNSYYYAK